MSTFKFLWTTHKWVGILIAAVVLNTAVTGFLLLMKKRVAWIQPREHSGQTGHSLVVSFDQMLHLLRTLPETQVRSWEDVDRLDVRPGKGMVKVQCKNRWEVQIDLSNGRLLQVMMRRSDLIESIHDGSFIGAAVHSYIMPLCALGLSYLAISGLALWIEPKIRAKTRRRSRAGC